MRVGVISDTHGLLRAEAKAALQGVDQILHAGDIGKPEVIEQLNSIAPVTAIKGNIDSGEWAREFPDTRTVSLGGRRIHLLHDLKSLDFDPREQDIDLVISGHSHKPKIESRDEVLYLNPGSAGPRRFSLPVALAMLVLESDNVDARIIELDIRTGKRK